MSKKEKKRTIKSLYYWLVGHRSRPTYWTCSKLAAWIREKGDVTKKPHATTAEGWNEWHKLNSKKFAYWVSEEGLDYLQDIWLFFPDIYRRVRIYVTNRFIDRPHLLDTKLEPGDWYEFETRVVHGLFEALVTFVEDEKAAMMRWTSTEKFKLPNAEKGIEHLKWEMTLAEEKPDEPDYYPMPEQAARAKETLDLYNWWKHTRPLREEPGDAVGLWEFHDRMREKYREDDDEHFWGSLSKKYNDEDEAERKRLYEASNKEEQRQYEEDTEMLIRLVKLRQDLWT